MSLFHFDIGLPVFDILPCPREDKAVVIRSNTELHALFKRGVVLGEVENMESAFCFIPIKHPEKEPLCASGSIEVFGEVQVVLVLAGVGFGSYGQIPRLETTLE